MEIFENYGHEHRTRTLISLTLVILFALAGVFRFSNFSMIFIAAILLLFYVIYGAVRRANYPNIIKINARGRDMSFYPRKEHDMLILKSIANEMLKSR